MARITSYSGIFLSVSALVGCDPKETPAEDGGSACVAPSVPNFAIDIAPAPEQEYGEVAFDGTCSVTRVSDTPLSMELSCDGSPIPQLVVDVTGGPDASWASVFGPGDIVDVRYAAYWRVDRSPTWLAIRVTGEDEPAVVTVDAHVPLPFFDVVPGFMAPVELDFLDDTDCAESAGSCNIGVQRRAAVEASVDGSEPVVVFDHDAGVVSSYDIAVGEARADEGACEESNATWYEVMMTRAGNG